MVMLRHAVRINGLTEIVLTKLDILSGLPQIKVCMGYEVNGRRLNYYPTTPSLLDDCTPIYETLPGWDTDIMPARRLADLPLNARNYVSFIAANAETPVSCISVGPGREQIIVNQQQS
jgi:adenylosuccinate synthase